MHEQCLVVTGLMKRDNGPGVPWRGRLDPANWTRDVAQLPQKATGIATTVLALALIARLTLKPMGSTFPTHFDVCLLCGEVGTANFVLNVLLFVPLGLGLRLIGVPRWAICVVGLALTVSIETLQFYVVPGRDSDLGDIIANTTGAVVGIAVVDFHRIWLAPASHVAGWLGGVTALCICTGAALVQWSLAPWLSHAVYYEQIAPDLPGYALFNGAVSDATFDGAGIGIGRMSMTASAAMRDSLLADSAVIAVTLQPGTTRNEVAPIVAVHDISRREIFLLARRGDDLLFRLRRRTAVLGFHTPSAVLTNAFPTAAAATDTLAVRAVVASGSTTLYVASSGPHGTTNLRRRVSQGLWDAWRLFIPDEGRWGRHATELTLLSMAFLFVPIGYWSGRGARHEGTMLSVISIAMPVAAAFAIIPWAASAPAAAWPVWVAGLAGAGAAWGAGAFGARERSGAERRKETPPRSGSL